MRSGVREDYSDAPRRTRHPIVVGVPVVVVAITLDAVAAPVGAGGTVTWAVALGMNQ